MTLDTSSFESGSARIHARVGEYDAVLDYAEELSLRIDAEGRWCSVRRGADFYQRLVDGGVVQKKHARPANVAEAASVHQLAQSVATEFERALRAGTAPLELSGSCPDADRLLAYVESARAWDLVRLDRERERFRNAYPEDVRIVPPDRYRDIVLLPALGCPNASCTFCTFYPGRRFRVLDANELERHIRAVLELFGRALGLRTGAFLGSGNALAVPHPTLLRVLARIRSVLPDLPRGIAAFWDPEHAPRRTHAQWRELASLGLTRVFPGLETALPELRALFGKSSDVAGFANALDGPRAAGIRIGITVLTGMGDDERRHREATALAIEAMQLSPEDLVYVSPLRDAGTAEGSDVGMPQMVRALRVRTKAQVAPYLIERFRYYS